MEDTNDTARTIKRLARSLADERAWNDPALSPVLTDREWAIYDSVGLPSDDDFAFSTFIREFQARLREYDLGMRTREDLERSHGDIQVPLRYVLPWVREALSRYMLRSLQWSEREQQAPASREFWRGRIAELLDKAPDLVWSERGYVSIGWYVDGRPASARAPRDIAWMEIHPDGDVCWGDTRIHWLR